MAQVVRGNGQLGLVRCCFSVTGANWRKLQQHSPGGVANQSKRVFCKFRIYYLLKAPNPGVSKQNQQDIVIMPIWAAFQCYPFIKNVYSFFDVSCVTVQSTNLPASS